MRSLLLEALVVGSLSVPEENSHTNTKNDDNNNNYGDDDSSREGLAVSAIAFQVTRDASGDGSQGEESNLGVH